MSDADDIKGLYALSETIERGIEALERRAEAAERQFQNVRNCLSETRDGPIDLDRLKDGGISRTFIALLNGELH